MRVLLFGHLKKVVGGAELALPTLEPMTMDQFWERLITLCPALAEYRPVARVARNMEFTRSETMLHPGDEAALLPPVSGG